MKLQNKVLIFLGILGFDQVTKYLIIRFLEHSISFNDFFVLTLTHNQGVAFSFPVPKVLLIGGTSIALGVLAWFLFQKKHSYLEQWAFLLILSGGIGNLIDRIFRVGVVDFLRFWSFPVFNIADIMISIGVGLIAIEIIKKK